MQRMLRELRVGVVGFGAMKRKTLHLAPVRWHREYPVPYLKYRIERFKEWRYWFQHKGVVAACGLRVHTLDKLADSPGQATCRACKDLIALDLLANT